MQRNRHKILKMVNKKRPHDLMHKIHCTTVKGNVTPNPGKLNINANQRNHQMLQVKKSNGK